MELLDYTLDTLKAVASRKIRVYVSSGNEFVFFPFQLYQLRKFAYTLIRHMKHWTRLTDMEKGMDIVANLQQTSFLLEIPSQIEIFGPIEVPWISPHNNSVEPIHLLIQQMLIEITSSYVTPKTYRLVI